MNNKPEQIFITEIVSDEPIGKNCGGCGWETTVFYGLGTSKAKAKAVFEKDHNGRGLCGNCLVEILESGHYTVTAPKDVK